MVKIAAEGQTVLEQYAPTTSLGEGVAYFKGARIALSFLAGVADERDPELAAALDSLLSRLPGGVGRELG